MTNVLLFILAVVPGLLLCYFIFSMDKYEKEPQRYLFICFLLGVMMTLPAIQMETIGQKFVDENSKDFFKIFIFATFVIGFSEEILKFLALLLFAYPKKDFNEPMDGIVYSMMVGMGFATMENILYAHHYGFATVIARAFTSMPGHGIFAILMGYFVGKAKFTDSIFQKIYLIGKGFFAALLAHGVYDFLLLQEKYQTLMMCATVLIVLGALYAVVLITKQQKVSPFRDDHHNEFTTNELALSDRVRFVQDEDIISTMLTRMKTNHTVLPENWGEIYVEKMSEDKWLLFNINEGFTEDTSPRFVHLPGPSPKEVVNLIFTAEQDDEIKSAAEYLKLTEYYDNNNFRERLVNCIAEFDPENLSDLHRERMVLLILETQLNQTTKDNVIAEKAHDFLKILC
jgi:protease PrsW